MKLKIKKFKSPSCQTTILGIAIHPKEPYILTSLKNGNIKLWDYRTLTCVREFNEHTESVWGIDFHLNKPIFVSGGDDLEIKVWNYKNTESLFTLNDHKELLREQDLYERRINTTFFHNKYPWIVSASNDKTIGIWDWTSRTRISTLTDHTSYVNCARFHNTEDLVVSVSDDEEIRVWDISNLVKINIRKNTENEMIDALNGIAAVHVGDLKDIYSIEPLRNVHKEKINWLSFQPNKELIASSSDDGWVKTWRLNATNYTKDRTYNDNSHKFNRAIFLPRDDVLLSTSLDGSIRVFTISDTTITTESLDLSILALAAHPTQNLFAVGGDNGFAVKKFERDRSASTVHNESLYYIKGDAVHRYGLDTEHDESLPLIIGKKTIYSKAYSMAINNTGDHVIIVYRGLSTDHFLYHIYSMPIDNMSQQDGMCHNGFNAVWVSHDQFAVLEKSRKVTIRGLDNAVIKTLSIENVKDIYYANRGHLVIKMDDCVIIYNVEDEVDVHSINHAIDLHLVMWSKDWEHVALLSKTKLQIYNKNQNNEEFYSADTSIKSGCWSDNGVFLYSTITDLRYLDRSKNKSVKIRELDKLIYVTRMRGDRVWFIDQGGSPGELTLTNTEFPISRKRSHQTVDQ